MIPSNEIHQKKKKCTAMMHSGTRPKKKLFHLSQIVVLPLLATTSKPLTVSEIGKNEKLLVSVNKYRAAEVNILNKTKAMVDLSNFRPKLIES